MAPRRHTDRTATGRNRQPDNMQTKLQNPMATDRTATGRLDNGGLQVRVSAAAEPEFLSSGVAGSGRVSAAAPEFLASGVAGGLECGRAGNEKAIFRSRAAIRMTTMTRFWRPDGTQTERQPDVTFIPTAHRQNYNRPKPAARQHADKTAKPDSRQTEPPTWQLAGKAAGIVDGKSRREFLSE